MRITATLFAIILLRCATARAQIAIIPRAGVSLGKYAVKEGFFSQDQKYVLGLTAGVGLNIPVAKDGFFSLQPELNYIQKGYQYKSSSYSEFIASHTTYKRTLNYLELPLLAKVSLGSTRIKGYVNAGPSFGFALNGKYEYSMEFINIDAPVLAAKGRVKFKDKPENYAGNNAYHNAEGFNRLDIGLQFGGGVGFQAGPGTLLLDVRYGLGLTNFVKDHTAFFTTENLDGEPVQIGFKVQANEKSRPFAFTLGYAIPLNQ